MAAQSKWYLSDRLKSQPDVICPKIALAYPTRTALKQDAGQKRLWMLELLPSLGF